MQYWHVLEKIMSEEKKDFIQELTDKAKLEQLTKVEELYIKTAKRKSELW